MALDQRDIAAVFAAMKEMSIPELTVTFAGADDDMRIGPVGLPRDLDDQADLQRLIEQEREARERYVGFGIQFPLATVVRSQTKALLELESLDEWEAGLGADGFVRWLCPAEGEPEIMIEMLRRVISIEERKYRFPQALLWSLPSSQDEE